MVLRLIRMVEILIDNITEQSYGQINLIKQLFG